MLLVKLYFSFMCVDFLLFIISMHRDVRVFGILKLISAYMYLHVYICEYRLKIRRSISNTVEHLFNIQKMRTVFCFHNREEHVHLLSITKLYLFLLYQVCMCGVLILSWMCRTLANVMNN